MTLEGVCRARAKRLVGIKNINGTHPGMCPDDLIVKWLSGKDNVANFAVYALGFYIDEEEAKQVLGPKYKSKGVSALVKSQEFCNGKLYDKV